MKIIEPSFEILEMPTPGEIYRLIETAGRVCYKSENKIDAKSAEKFCAKILHSGHESVIEHASITVKIVCDRGVSHELVRHRLCSFSQESTRYANYSKDRFGNEITVIKPLFFGHGSDLYSIWHDQMSKVEDAYMALLQSGATAQEARSVLPNSLKTEIVITANIREWMHIFKLRCSGQAHPQMREIMCLVRGDFARLLPVFFGGGDPWGER